MSKQKHILFISSWYPNKNNPGHGIFNYNFAKTAAINNKVSVIHVSSANNQTTDFVTECNQEAEVFEIQVYYKKVNLKIPLLSHWLKLKKQKQAFDKAYNLLLEKTGKPDLIQLNVVMPAGLGVLHLAKKHQIPYVVNESWSGYCAEDGNYKGFLTKYFSQKIIAGAKAIMPVSEFLKEAMLQHGLKGNYNIVPNVVDMNNFKPGKTHQDSVTRFIHISSLTNREKNIGGIIRAFTHALKTNPEMELVVVGEGDERKNWEDYAVALDKFNCIKFAGRIPQTHLADAINNADALLMFSHFETFCLVVIEALACGKPVITSNAGAIQAIMKPEFGLMVEKGNEAHLTEAILTFCKTKNTYNAELLRNYAKENFSPEKINSLLNDVYNQVLS